MSISDDRRLILCDGDGCRATASLPVALRPALSRHLCRASAISTSEGWLYVRRGDRTEHYCPSCGKETLAGIAQDIAR